MKTLNWIILTSLVVITSCSDSNTTTRQDGIEGVYVKEIAHEFATGTDTVFIKPFQKEINKYHVTSSSTYTQTIDGKKLTPASEKHRWIGVFDNKLMILTIENKGKVFHYTPGNKRLTIGSSEYSKISGD